jgi:hypothetical protein
MGGRNGKGRRELLRDEQGPIPEFPPVATDAEGRYILPGPEEVKARYDAFRRAWKVLDAMPEEEGEGERWAEAMRSLGVPVDPTDTGR